MSSSEKNAPAPRTAFVLGAGLGTRLRPLTNELPKPLLPVAGRPMIESCFERLRAVGVRRILINTHWKPEAYERAYPERRWRDVELVFVHEPVLLETGGGLKNIEPLLDPGDDHLWVYNGDIFAGPDLGKLWQAHIDTGAEATLLLRDTGNVKVDTATGAVLDLRGRLGVTAGASRQFSGISLVRRDFFRHLRAGVVESLVEGWLRALVETPGNVRGVTDDTFRWADLGTIAEYEAIRSEAATRQLESAMTLPELEQLALLAAQSAGDALVAAADKTINTLTATDVKAKADEDAERVVRDILTRSGLPVIGEELGGDAALWESKDEPYWVVDPIDGTYNYLRDQPATCVAVALMCGKEPVLGVIREFAAGNTFLGVVGKGVFVNGVRIQPAWATEIGQACLMTGFPAAADKSPEALAGFIRDVGRFKKIRMIGSAALAVAYVGVGRADVYYENATNLWDVAAGLALVKAGGGVYTVEETGKRPLNFNVRAAGRAEWL